jgi:NADP-reducing hydrogenase subunit HndD
MSTSPGRHGADATAVTLTVDDRWVTAPAGTRLLDVLRAAGIDTPTLCALTTLAPANACRVCVVELEGARTLVPACSRVAEAGMVVRTDSERVRHARKLVLELLASAVDLSRASDELKGWMARYDADPARFGPPAPAAAAGERDAAHAGHHAPAVPGQAATVAEPVRIDNPLYVRDYARCVLCYRCVDACGEQAQNTFAIAVAGRGFDARIATEFAIPLPESACVYCGNCVAVCPTGALVGRREYDLREAGAWDESRQQVTRTVCTYCGVGCNLELHVQDNTIVKVTSPMDHEVTSGHLCIKGRFGFEFVQVREPGSPAT